MRSPKIINRRERHVRGRNKKRVVILFSIPVLLVTCVAIYNLPLVYERLSWRVAELRTNIIYKISPPEEALFVPSEADQNQSGLQATLDSMVGEGTATPTPTSVTVLPQVATYVPTITPTLLPEKIFLEGVIYIDQRNRWNYCGPANLTMGLKYWGWSGNRDDIARVIKPGVNDPDLDFIQRGKTDKNVMPYEMANFVADETEFSVVVRNGGNLEVVKRLIASGFPVVIEKGYYEADYTGKIAWLGHYQFVTGYDEMAGTFTVQDAWLEPGDNLKVAYDQFIEGWRSFNYLFIVIYPPDREFELYNLLGQWGDPVWANQHALEVAMLESEQLFGIDKFFAWFNVGASHVSLLQYTEAGIAYDIAFLIYADIGEGDNQRPYRIMWYQTGPYWAYYYTGRYQDVINLAYTTLYETIAEPTLEESLYWRGKAREALGDVPGAISDFRETVRLNSSFSPGWAELNRLGVTP